MKKAFIILLILFLCQLNAQCFTVVDRGGYFTLALKSDHTLWAWGANISGEYGNGTLTASTTPIQIGTGTNWASIATGSAHSIALKTNGTLWAWGQNADGRLGDGTFTNQLVPKQIGTSTDWVSIYTTANSNFAIKANGTLWFWGQNYNCESGLGFVSACVLIPTQVGTDTDWKSIGDSSNHILALKNNNTLWSWGNNTEGQQGNGFFLGTTLLPTQIGTDTNWKSVSAGSNHSMALKIDGSLYVWGGNGDGQLGDGTLTPKTVPTKITDGTVWKRILAAGFISYGIKDDNTLWVWGTNSYGQFGDGTTIASNIPKQIGTDTDWNYLTTGGNKNTAVKLDNSIYMWGVLPGNTLPTVPDYALPTIFQVECTLSNTQFEQNNIAIYPNPAADKVFISSKNNDTILNIRLFDLAGKLILQQSNAAELVVAHLAKGVYILTVESEKNTQSFKVIKE